jgi:hypothetical protein
MFQHVSSLRSENVPRDAADLLSQRGKGRTSVFKGGGFPTPGTGMPIVSLLRWDSGVVGFGRAGPFEYVGGFTTGTLSNPLVIDENDGKQILGRLRLRLRPELELGASAARGPYLDRRVASAIPDFEDFHQTVAGADWHFGRGHLLLYAEAAWSRWQTPHIGALDTVSGYLEGRYRLAPGFYIAGRLDRMGFSEVNGPDGRPEPWDFPLNRAEIGWGYSWEKNAVIKVALQVNRFEGARALDENILAVQIALRY